MATHFWIDKSEKTAAVYSKLIKKFFPSLKKAQFLFTLRDKEKTDDEGNVIVAEARRIGTKERDLWGFDFEICMDAEIWAKANQVNKYRIAYHELNHCGVEMEEGTSDPKYDDNNRLKTFMIKHDLFLKTFKAEIEIFGFEGADHEVATFMSEMMDSRDAIKKNKKKFMGELGIELYKETASEPEVKKKKKKKKTTSEDLEAAADKILGIKKKNKEKFTEVSMSTVKKKKKRPSDY